MNLKSCIHISLTFLLLSLIAFNVSALQIEYQVVKGDFSYCKGQAKHLLKVFITNAEKQGILKASLSNLEKPCEPPYGARVFEAKKTKQELDFYFLSLGDAQKLFLDVEFLSGEKKHYEFSLTPTISPTPHEQTPTPTFKETSNNLFSISIRDLWIAFAIILALLATCLVLYAIYSITEKTEKRKEGYTAGSFSNPQSTYRQEHPYTRFKILSGNDIIETPPKILSKNDTIETTLQATEDIGSYGICSKCGQKVYLPFRCHYCGNYFCEDHRLPPKHDCRGIDSWKNTPPPVG